LVNVLFLAYRDAADLVGHFASCHIGLVTQEDAALGCVVPSKCYPFLSAGRPFLFVGPAQATPALLIERYGCGWRIAPGDIDALTALLQRLAAEPELVRVAGRRARETFVNRYDRHAGVSRILSVLAKESYSQVDQKHPVQHGI
jgi:colanic acid biosynthesis glycosyl transferase WcaI